MTKKIGISLPDDLYEWATGEVEKGSADSVSGLIADALDAVRARTEVDALYDEIKGDLENLSEEDLAQIEEFRAAAAEAQRRHLMKKKASKAA